jgi:hypothetical protein
MRQLSNDRHGIVALLSFSNVAVDTFRKEYYLLARERGGSSFASAVEIDTVDGFLTTNIIRPHAFRSMGAMRTPYLVQGHEPFLKGQKVFDGSRPHPTANLDVTIENGSFQFKAISGYASVPISTAEAVKSINNLGRTGAYTHSLGRYWAIKVLTEQPYVLRAMARRYPMILIDEAQDVGPVHQVILEALVDSGCQLSLIGDKSQGIYHFSGATGQFLEEYGNKSGVQSLGLTINYRSVPSIVAVANKLAGRTDTADRKPLNTLHGAFYLPYKRKEKDKLQSAFRSMIDTAAIPVSNSVILCRSSEWVEEWRGGEEAHGQGAVKAFINATICRDKLRRYDEAFRHACNGITSLLADSHGDLAVRISRNDAHVDTIRLKRAIWAFARDANDGLPSGKLVADAEWHPLLVKRVKALLDSLDKQFGLRTGENVGLKLKKTNLLNNPIIDMPDLASGMPAEFHVSTVHQVKGESIDAVMYVANKEQIRAMIDGPTTEVGSIGYVAVTRARNLLVLGVPDNCLSELEPELIGCGFKRVRI